MNIKRKSMNKAGKVLALMGFGLILVGLFGRSFCVTEPNFDIEVCFSILRINQSGGWQYWIITNREALLILAPVIGCLVAYFSEDRFAIFVGGLCLVSVTLLGFVNNVISADEIDIISSEWAWFAVLGGTACLILSAFPSDPLFVADERDVLGLVSDSLSSPSVHPSPPQPETLHILTTARAIAVVGIIILAFGGTVAPAFCGDRFDQGCGSHKNFDFFDAQSFEDDFSSGIQHNSFSISIVLMSIIAVAATIVKRPLSVSVVGWSSLAYVFSTFLYFWAGFSANEQNIIEHIRWGWIGLFGGPLLLIMAANQFKRAETLNIHT